jgi:hypothetical protein
MKTLYTQLCFVFGLIAFVYAQTPPQAFKYQAVCRDANGNPILNQAVNFKIGIIQGSITGTLVYSEYQLDTTNAYGVSNLEIGRGQAISGTFGAINWGNGPHFITLSFDPAGGTAFVPLGTQELLSVPYALYAGSSNTPGPQGPQGPQGVSITNSWVQGDSLYVALSNSQTLNTGHVRGATGAQGVQGSAGSNGPQGVSVVNSWVMGDSLYVALSNSQTLNTGNVRGPAGPGITYTAGTGISLNNNTVTNTAPDQVVSLQGSGTTSITGSYPNFNIQSSDTTMWKRSGSNIYYSSGNVGIGPLIWSWNPTKALTVRDFNYNSGAATIEAYVTDNLGDPPVLGVRGANDGGAILEISKPLGAARNWGLIRMGVDGSNMTHLFGVNGGLGIGIQPARTLHVNDVMRLEPRNTAPSNPGKGDMYFDNLTNKLRVYDGSVWRDCW